MITVAGLDLDWLGAPGDASLGGESGDDVLSMSAGPTTDWFNDPTSTTRVADAPALMAPVAGDFQLSALVTVDFASTFDAGVLFVHQTGDDCAKLCFELDPTGQPMIVTVVTRGVSDDSNEPAIQGNAVHQRVSRFGDAFAFHYSLDATAWKLSRLFALRDPTLPVTVGFVSQSPTGDGCTTCFCDIEFARTTLRDPRNGT